MTNPNLGKSVDLAWLKTSFKEAAALGEDETRRWLSQHANAELTRFPGATEGWSGAEVWGNAARPGLSLEWILSHCGRYALGFDGGGADDLSTLALIGMDSAGCWYLWTQSWVWPVALQRRQSIASILQRFQDDGDLQIVEPGQDTLEVVSIVRQVYDYSPSGFHALGCDPNGIAGELAMECESRGIARAKLLAVSQGYKLRPGWLALERRLRQGRLSHGGQPILDWAVSNTRQDPVSGLVTKKAAGVGKIDPVVACAIAGVVALDAPSQHWDVKAMIA